MDNPSEPDRPAFVVSIDTEMAWGLTHRQDQHYRYDRERADIERLLRLFDEHAIPATWAIVGHLMLDHCEPVDGVKHPEIVRPDFSWFKGDWFDDDPCTDSERDPMWYAPDVVELIRAADTDHEIASHGFSHIVAGDPGCSRETFDSELAQAVAVAADQGLTIRSLIHPRNQIGHTDLLADHGIVAYRGRRPAATTPSSRLQRLVEQTIDRTIGSERTAVRPIQEGPLWNMPSTTMFDVDARPRTWRLWIRQVERRLAQAVARRSLFHVWFHPHNLRDHPEASFAALDRLCAAAARHRNAGRLDTVTMGGLADALGPSSPPRPMPASTGSESPASSDRPATNGGDSSRGR